MKGAHEEFEADDGVDDDDEEDEQGDVHQGNDGHQDGVHHNLQTCGRQELNNQRVKTFYLFFILGTPEISLRGRRTLKALRAFTSKPSICKTARIELINLRGEITISQAQSNCVKYLEAFIAVQCVTAGLINDVVWPCVPSPFD